jgi:dihydrofolate reductase
LSGGTALARLQVKETMTMTQRRIVMFNQVSADGYFADSDGGLDWVVSDPEVHARAVASMPDSDTVLFGRRTYEMFAAYWPQALKDLKKPGPHGEDKAEAGFAAMARWLNEAKKLVASRSLKNASWNHTEVLGELTPARVSALKKQPGKGILVFGSGSIVSLLSEHGLIDEYRFVVCPLLLGDGRNLLQGLPGHVGLKLKEAQSFRTGNVMLTYTLAAK